MSPKIGRPTNNPRNQRIEIRLASDELIILNYCCKTLNMTRSDVLRTGIKVLYQKALEKETADKQKK